MIDLRVFNLLNCNYELYVVDSFLKIFKKIWYMSLWVFFFVICLYFLSNCVLFIIYNNINCFSMLLEMIFINYWLDWFIVFSYDILIYEFMFVFYLWCYVWVDKMVCDMLFLVLVNDDVKYWFCVCF